MSNEYIIINKTTLQKRIEELEKTKYSGLRVDLEVLKEILSQSTPLIPEIEHTAALQTKYDRLKRNYELAKKVPDQVKADVDKYGDLIVELNKVKAENKRLREGIKQEIIAAYNQGTWGSYLNGEEYIHQNESVKDFLTNKQEEQNNE